MDFANYRSSDILMEVDRASILKSLELRSPLLDYRLLEGQVRGRVNGERLFGLVIFELWPRKY